MATLSEKVAIAGVRLVIVLMLAGGLKRRYERTTATGAFRHEISGKILSKHIHTYEEDEGSKLSRRLIIEEKSGRQTRITVSSQVWQEAQVGQWLIRDARGTRFSAREPRPPIDLPPSPNVIHSPQP
jgi:hypothetical protein